MSPVYKHMGEECRPYECMVGSGQIPVLMIPTKVYPGRNRGKAVGFDDNGKT